MSIRLDYETGKISHEERSCENCIHDSKSCYEYPCTKCKSNHAEPNDYPDLWTDVEAENVNHPSHYQGKNECIDVMIAMFGIEAVKSFCKCNAYKYRFRAAMKNGDEDIKKAEWYESKLIDLEAGE